MLPKELQEILSIEIEDTNQAEIITDDDYPIVDKLAQMRYLLTLLPQQAVQKGLFDE